MRTKKREKKVLTALMAGLLVWLISSGADFALLPIDRALLPRLFSANFIAGLITVVVSLVIQLRHEAVHYDVALARAAIVAELNHHVRNAVFPLYIAVQRVGDAEAKRIADDAVERINLALRDATADALSRGVEYTVTSASAENAA